MPATRPRLNGLTIPVLALLASLASGMIACETTPMDMWITMDPDAGSNFDAPPRDVGSRDGTGGTGGTGGSGGAAGDTGSGTAGTTGSGGGGTGGDAGSGGGAGTGGAAGNN